MTEAEIVKMLDEAEARAREKASEQRSDKAEATREPAPARRTLPADYPFGMPLTRGPKQRD